MYNKILNIYKAFQRRQYHAMHKNNAGKKLRHLELAKGKLSDNLRKQCDEYALDILGSKKYAPWLYVYTAMQNEFKKGWIPDNYYGEIIVPKLKGAYGGIANLKTLQTALFHSNLFPDLFYYVNDQWLTKEYKIVSQDYVRDYITSNPGKYVYKIDNSQSGKGVFILDENLKLNKLMQKKNGVLQSYIKQHRFFHEIVSNSVATIRLTTVNDQHGNITLRGAYLRVGRALDNKVSSASGVRIPIDLKTGKLGDFGYDNNLTEFATHPDTGYVFREKTLPIFFDIKKEVLALHSKVPFTRIVGWDVVVDYKNSIKVMEWNGMHNTIYFDEITKGPIFKGLDFEDLWKENSK